MGSRRERDLQRSRLKSRKNGEEEMDRRSYWLIRRGEDKEKYGESMKNWEQNKVEEEETEDER